MRLASALLSGLLAILIQAQALAGSVGFMTLAVPDGADPAIEVRRVVSHRCHAAPHSRRPVHAGCCAGRAGHFDFLAPCSERLARMVPTVCASAPGFDRASFHRALNAEVVRFFTQALSPR